MVQAVVREIVAHGSTAVKVDGPYGEPTEVDAKADTPVLLVAGGVGVGPPHASRMLLISWICGLSHPVLAIEPCL